MASQTSTLSQDTSSSEPNLNGSTWLGVVVRLDAQGRILQRWRVRDSKCTIGSDAQASIYLDDSSILPVHGLIVFGARHAIFRAFAPAMTLNRNPVRESVLNEGDIIESGNLRLRIEAIGSQSPIQQRAPLRESYHNHEVESTASGQQTQRALSPLQFSALAPAAIVPPVAVAPVKPAAPSVQASSNHQAPVSNSSPSNNGAAPSTATAPSYSSGDIAEALERVGTTLISAFGRWTSSIDQRLASAPVAQVASVAAAPAAIDTRNQERLEKELRKQRKWLSQQQEVLQLQVQALHDKLPGYTRDVLKSFSEQTQTQFDGMLGRFQELESRIDQLAAEERGVKDIASITAPLEAIQGELTRSQQNWNQLEQKLALIQQTIHDNSQSQQEIDSLLGNVQQILAEQSDRIETRHQANIATSELLQNQLATHQEKIEQIALQVEQLQHATVSPPTDEHGVSNTALQNELAKLSLRQQELECEVANFREILAQIRENNTPNYSNLSPQVPVQHDSVSLLALSGQAKPLFQEAIEEPAASYSYQNPVTPYVPNNQSAIVNGLPSWMQAPETDLEPIDAANPGFAAAAYPANDSVETASQNEASNWPPSNNAADEAAAPYGQESYAETEYPAGDAPGEFLRSFNDPTASAPLSPASANISPWDNADPANYQNASNEEVPYEGSYSENTPYSHEASGHQYADGSFGEEAPEQEAPWRALLREQSEDQLRQEAEYQLALQQQAHYPETNGQENFGQENDLSNQGFESQEGAPEDDLLARLKALREETPEPANIPPPAATSPVSALDVLNGNSALPEEEENIPPPAPVAKPAPAKPAVKSGGSKKEKSRGKVAGSSGGPEEDESVELYMQRLLARMRGEPEPEGIEEEEEAEAPVAPVKATRTFSSARSAPSPATPATGEGVVATAAPRARATAAGGAPSTAPFNEGTTEEPARPRGVPESASELQNLRELANHSARAAIQTSTSKKKKGISPVAKLGIGGGCAFMGLGLIGINGLTVNLLFVAGVAFFLFGVAWGYDGANGMGLLNKKK